MPKLMKWFAPIVVVLAISGCQELTDPIPVVFSRTADGALIAEAPLCEGETVRSVKVGMTVDNDYRRSGNTGVDTPNPSDQTLTIDLSPEAIASGSLTDQFPMLDGSHLGNADAVPDRLSFSMSTKQTRAFVSLIDVNPVQGQPVLVMGEVTRTNKSTAISTIDPASATALLDTWCVDQRED